MPNINGLWFLIIIPVLIALWVLFIHRKATRKSKTPPPIPAENAQPDSAPRAQTDYPRKPSYIRHRTYRKTK